MFIIESRLNLTKFLTKSCAVYAPNPTSASDSKQKNNDYVKCRFLLSLQPNTTSNTNQIDNEVEIK